LWAPGEDILTAGVNSDSSCTSVSGTSLAAAHAAGAAALAMTVDATYDAQDVFTTLVNQTWDGQLHNIQTNSPNKLLSVGQVSERVPVFIGQSPVTVTSVPSSAVALFSTSTSTKKKKCVDAPAKNLQCATNAGDYGQRLGIDDFKDTFKITVEGDQICAERQDGFEDSFLAHKRYSASLYDISGWTVNLEAVCEVQKVAKSKTPSPDKFLFTPMGPDNASQDNVVCAGEHPTDRKSNYFAVFENVTSAEHCQEQCVHHTGCKGYGYGPKYTCEIWMKPIQSFLQIPKQYTHEKSTCSVLEGWGTSGSGLIRAAQAPGMCLEVREVAQKSSNLPLNIVAMRECDESNEFQQLAWSGAGTVTLLAQTAKCFTAFESQALKDKHIAKAIVLTDCGETTQPNQTFSFAGSGMFRHKAQSCMDGKTFANDTIVELQACDSRNPRMQYFF